MANEILDTGTDLLSVETGGTGDNDKVAVSSGKTAGYLSEVLVSSSDLVSLVPVGNQLRVQVNTELSYDPKLQTLEEWAIDSATSNYGSYSLKSGYSSLVWGDESNQSYDWLNASVHQHVRIATSQGTLTKCNVAICGSLSFTNPPPCLNVGVFDLEGNLLGSTGLRNYGTDFDSGVQLATFDMAETATGSLDLKRNTRYIVQVWSCGLQLAAMDKTNNYNYTYDYNLRQNLEGTVSKPTFVPIGTLSSRASQIPYASFGAAALN